MGRILDRIESLALALGAPGLFLVTFLDSSFLSFPEATDLLLVWMITTHKERFVLYASSAVLGSVAGSLTLYFVGRKGGEALVRSRFSTARVDRALATIQRHGVVAVLIPSLLPPPAPFKIFVLLAGVAGIPVSRFAAALALGRATRYFGEGLLALRYGDRAFEFIHANGATVSFSMAIVVAAGVAGYLVWTKAERRRRR
jgi:membrane protein YqaA with SNARE-associated domain